MCHCQVAVFAPHACFHADQQPTNQRTTLEKEGDVLPVRPGEGAGLGFDSSKGDLGGTGGVKHEITEAPPPWRSRLPTPPPLVSFPLVTSLMKSLTPSGSSDGEVGVFTSRIVINGPPVMTSSAVDSGMILTCMSISMPPVVVVTSELSSLVVMVMTLPEVVS